MVQNTLTPSQIFPHHTQHLLEVCENRRHHAPGVVGMWTTPTLFGRRFMLSLHMLPHSLWTTPWHNFSYTTQPCLKRTILSHWPYTWWTRPDCIPIHWHSTRIPTIEEWFTRLSKIDEMEELVHISQEWIQKFAITWSCWTPFKITKHYCHYVPWTQLISTRQLILSIPGRGKAMGSGPTLNRLLLGRNTYPSPPSLPPLFLFSVGHLPIFSCFLSSLSHLFFSPLAPLPPPLFFLPVSQVFFKPHYLQSTATIWHIHNRTPLTLSWSGTSL